jgi:hypothetical protein
MDPCCNCYYYWCAPQQCYYPVTYINMAQPQDGGKPLTGIPMVPAPQDAPKPPSNLPPMPPASPQ